MGTYIHSLPLSAINPSRLCELQSFGEISCRDVSLLSNIMELKAMIRHDMITHSNHKPGCEQYFLFTKLQSITAQKETYMHSRTRDSCL